MTARDAIYTLFDLGYIDEEHATAALLAVDAGMRRAPQRPAGSERSLTLPDLPRHREGPGGGDPISIGGRS